MATRRSERADGHGRSRSSTILMSSFALFPQNIASVPSLKAIAPGRHD